MLTNQIDPRFRGDFGVGRHMAHATRARTLDPENLGPLQDWLCAELEADRLTIEKASLLGGGAIGENWKLDVIVSGGPHEGSRSWALRTDAASRMAMSHDRANEYFCLKAVHEAGACVPEPIAVSRDDSGCQAVERIVKLTGEDT